MAPKKGNRSGAGGSSKRKNTPAEQLPAKRAKGSKRGAAAAASQPAAKKVRKGRQPACPGGVAPPLTTIAALPDDVLQLVHQSLSFPHRFTAALVCRKWRDMIMHDPSRVRRATASINDAIQAARPGDTIVVPAGFYTVNRVTAWSSDKNWHVILCRSTI